MSGMFNTRTVFKVMNQFGNLPSLTKHVNSFGAFQQKQLAQFCVKFKLVYIMYKIYHQLQEHFNRIIIFNHDQSYGF